MNRRHFSIAGAATVACLAAAAPAVAQTPVTLSFNHVVLDTPATDDAQIVTPSTQPLTMTADVNPDGTFTVQPSDFNAPTYSTTTPVDATATVTLASPASGTVNTATGAFSLTADFLATLTVPTYGSCTFNTGNLTLTTATSQPLIGVKFPATATGYQSGDGAFGAAWSTLPAGTGTLCPEINSFVDGPGGIWISRGISLTQAEALAKPKLALKVTKPVTFNHTSAKETATIHATLSNTGAADTTPVKVCALAPNALSPTRQCITVAKLNANASRKLAFKLTDGRAGGGGTDTVKITATGLKTQSLTLKFPFTGSIF